MNPASPSPDSPPLLVLENLAVGPTEAGDRPWLAGVNASLRPGDFWVVSGAHGSGKSALLFTLAGLQPPMGGRISWTARDTPQPSGEDDVRARRRIGLVFDNGGRLFHRLTVLENVALPLCYHENQSFDEARPRAEALLGALDLLEWIHTTPGRLRPATRQRVALARALILQPEVLLLDDPVAGLGAQETQWWRETLRGFAAGHALTGGRALAVMVTLHELEPWVEVGTRFVRLQAGRWTPVNDRKELLALANPRVREGLAGGEPGG